MLQPAPKEIPIGCNHDALMHQAHRIAETYGFKIHHSALPRLNLTPLHLELLLDGFSPLFVDFSSQSILKRQHAGKQQGIIRACKPCVGLRIMDVTAGWGRDAALLASFGADVLMVERQPVMAALLADALERGTPKLSLQLLYANAMDVLKDLSDVDYPDVIYIDPMHPERQKSALVKKDMQTLQYLFGPDEDAQELLQLARQRVKSHVVVKWPERLKPLVTPTYAIHGKTVRFDCFRG